MVKVVVPIENTDTTVTRLIAKTVIEQLVFSTEMPEINDILYIQRGGNNIMAQTNAPGEALKLDVDNYIQVDYKEEEDGIQFDYNKYQFEYPSIFKASALGVSVTPMHSKVNLEMTFTYKAKSYSDLTTWLHAFSRRLLNAVAMNHHDVLYNYTIPTDVLAYLHQVYTLSETIAPYGQTLKQFLQQHFCTNGVVVRQNMNDTKQALAINVKNTGCLGVFTELPGIQETSKEPPISTVSFTYVLSYDRVTSVVLEYQMYIHNQVIDLTFLRKYEDRRLHSNPHAGNRTFTQSVNSVTENSYGLPAYPDAGTNTGDGWRPDNMPHNTYTSLVLPVQLDLLNLTDMLDLNVLSQFGYPSWLISLMQQYRSKLCAFKNWFVYIDAFEVNAELTALPLVVNSSFHLTSEVALNPRNRHYIRVSVLTELLFMDFSVFRKDPTTLLKLLYWIYLGKVNGVGTWTTLTTTNANGTWISLGPIKLKVIGAGSYVTTDSLWAMLNFINDSDLVLWKWMTVEDANLIVRKR